MNPLAFLPDEPPQEEKTLRPLDALSPRLSRIGRAKFLDRLLDIYGDAESPLFNGKEVCSVLGLAFHRRALARLDDDEKVVRNAHGLWHGQEMVFINESGLYHLIFLSRKAEARSFRKWVTAEVLPTLRRFGQYPAPKGRQIEPVKLTAELDALLPAEARSLPLRRQRIIAERLHCVRMVENAPHFGLRKKINHVVATRRQQGRPRRGFSWSAIYRFHRAYSQSGDWRCLDTHFENSGRRQIGG